MEMDDHNNQVASSSRPFDRVAIGEYIENKGRMISDSSQCMSRNSTDSGPQATGSFSREWTNEKHSMYLDSMEASFVRRLHSHEYHSMDMLGRNSKPGNLRDCNMSLQSNANDLKPSNQFKVLQSGCWKKINFESDHPKKNTEDECHVLLENQWVRHFRYAVKHQKLAPPNLQGKGAQNSESINPGGQKLELCGAVDQKKVCYGATVSSKKMLAICSYPPDKDYVSINTEGSDQNFVNELQQQPHIENPSRAKKMKKTTPTTKSEVQVAPPRQFLTVDLNLNEGLEDSACPQ